MNYLSCFRKDRVCGYQPELQPDHVFLFNVPLGIDLPDPALLLPMDDMIRKYWLAAYQPSGGVMQRSILFFSGGGAYAPGQYAKAAESAAYWGSFFYWTASDPPSYTPQAFPDPMVVTLQIGSGAGLLEMGLHNAQGTTIKIKSLDNLDIKWSNGVLSLSSKVSDQVWFVHLAGVTVAESKEARVDLTPIENDNAGALLIQCGAQANPISQTEISFSRVTETSNKFAVSHDMRACPFVSLGTATAACAIDTRDNGKVHAYPGEMLRSRLEFNGDAPLDSNICSENGQILQLLPKTGAQRGLLRLQLRVERGKINTSGHYLPFGSPAIFVPEGTFFHAGLKSGPAALPGAVQPCRLLWGATTTEFSGLQTRDSLCFKPGYPAVLSDKDSKNYSTAPGPNGLPPAAVARLANAQGYLTTSWMTITPYIAPGSPNREVFYFSEPAKSPQFGKPGAEVLLDDGGLPRANLKLGPIETRWLPVFPMVGRLPQPGETAANADSKPDPDASHLAEARRLIIRPSGGGGGKKHKRSQLKPGDRKGKPFVAGTRRGLTPQGILVDRADSGTFLDDYRTLYFGSAEPDLIDDDGYPTGAAQAEFTLDIAEPASPTPSPFYQKLQVALRASDLFMVFHNPTNAAKDVISTGATIQLRNFVVKVGAYMEGSGGVMIVKFFKNRSLDDLVKPDSMAAKLWACHDELAPGMTSADFAGLVSPPNPMESWYADFHDRVWTNKDWQGILFLNAGFGDMPPLFAALKGGMDDPKSGLKFHHFGLDYMQVQKTDLSPSPLYRMASAFGVLRYTGSGDPNWESTDVIPQDKPHIKLKALGKKARVLAKRARKHLTLRTSPTSYQFTVTRLALSFYNSKIKDFLCSVRVTFSHLFWDKILDSSPGGADKPLELTGTYESRPKEGGGTTDIFRLLLVKAATLKFDTAGNGCWLKEFVFEQAEFKVTSASGSGSVVSFLGISGTLNFNPDNLPLSSFVALESIHIAKMGVEFTYQASNDDRKVRFLLEGASVEAKIGPGSQALLSLLPVKFLGIDMALGSFNLDLGDLNFFPINITNNFGNTFSFGIRLEIDFGSLGGLVGFKDFKLPALVGWKPGLGKFAFGIQFPNFDKGEVNLTLMNFIGLKIQALRALNCKDAGFAIVMEKIQLVLFGQSWPTDDKFNLALFMRTEGERKLAWMAGIDNSSIPIIKYLGLGYRVSVPSDVGHSTQSVVDAYRKELSVESNPKPDDVCGWIAKQNNVDGEGWVLVSQLELGGIFTAAVALADKQGLYGVRVELLDLFGVDAFYRRIADGLGVYSCDINLADIIPPIQVGAASLTVPSVMLEIDTDGGFLLDLGYPRGADFSRSFKIEVLIFTGGGGFFFGSMSLAAATVLQLREDVGGFRPPNLADPNEVKYLKHYRVVRAGIAFRGGIGRSFSIGILKAEAALAFFGSMEGAIGTLGSARPRLWAVKGTIGILFTISAELDFFVLQAKAELLAYVETGFIFQKVLGYQGPLGHGTPYQITLPITLFVEVGLYVHVEVWVTIGCVQVKLFDLEFSGTWRLELDIGGLGADPAKGIGSHIYSQGRKLAFLNAVGGWTKDFRVWAGLKDVALLATVIPCAAARADLDIPSGDPYHGSMVGQMVSLPGPDGAFALLAEFMVRWALEVGDPADDVKHHDVIERRKVFSDPTQWSGTNAKWILDNIAQHFQLQLTALKKDGNIDSYVGLPLWPDVTWGFVTGSGGLGFQGANSMSLTLPPGCGLSSTAPNEGDTAKNLFIEYLRAMTNSFLDQIDRQFTHAEELQNLSYGDLVRPWADTWGIIVGTVNP